MCNEITATDQDRRQVVGGVRVCLGPLPWRLSEVCACGVWNPGQGLPVGRPSELGVTALGALQSRGDSVPLQRNCQLPGVLSAFGAWPIDGRSALGHLFGVTPSPESSCLLLPGLCVPITHRWASG